MTLNSTNVVVDRFNEMQILRYDVPGFEALPLNQKKLVYYLSQAALFGRDLIWEQNYKHNLWIRKTLEAVFQNYPGDRNSDDFQNFSNYLKQVWFCNGIHHHSTYQKLIPQMTEAAFKALVNACDPKVLPLNGLSVDEFLSEMTELLFDPERDGKKVSKDKDCDRVLASAVNYYENVTEEEALAFYADKKDPNDKTPISHGLNSTLVKEDGVLKEQVWKVGGRYSAVMEKMVYWLEKCLEVCESELQKTAFEKLIHYYRSGDLKDFDAYSVAWVQDSNSNVDAIHGFIEVYNDPIGFRGAYEAIVSIKDPEGTKRISAIAANAQWFEDHAPFFPEHKKEKVMGVAGAAINVVMEAGDSSPWTPIGVNLPNADWIRELHGSKSVNLSNVVVSYNLAGGPLQEEFTYSEEELACHDQYGELSDNLHTDLHEVIGHGSGKLNPGVATPKETLKHYSSTLEEARADLMALYFIYDANLVEKGILPNLEVGKAQYDYYIRNGLMVQLRRLSLGDNLEEDHMRNRQLIAAWVYEKGKEQQVIERVREDDKTYFVIRDYDALRELFGQLLKEIQRIKSEGDFQAGEALVETYGVKVDQEIHQDVLERFKKLNLASYSGFVNPKIKAIENEQGDIEDVLIEPTFCFADQMLGYAHDYGVL